MRVRRSILLRFIHLKLKRRWVCCLLLLAGWSALLLA
eukprot:COSAG01_NODE_70958_length_257_cov_0.658228_1_plen_36_part_01